jgi:HEPN domain-containing protein
MSYPKEHQILNIASELQRANSWIRRQRPDLVNLCYERVLELIDLTVEDPRWGRQLKELLRAREMLGQLYSKLSKNSELNQEILKNLVLLNPEAYRILYPTKNNNRISATPKRKKGINT